jgi:hypothetical protein
MTKVTQTIENVLMLSNTDTFKNIATALFRGATKYTTLAVNRMFMRELCIRCLFSDDPGQPEELAGLLRREVPNCICWWRIICMTVMERKEI